MPDLSGLPPELLIIAGILGLAVWIARQIYDLAIKLKNGKGGDTTELALCLQRIEDGVNKLLEWHEGDRRGMPKGVDMVRVERQIDEMHNLVTVKDDDGVPMVYTRVSVYRAIAKMVENQSIMIRILERMEQRIEKER